MLQILVWNIRARQTAAQIAYLTEETRADVLVLTEYQQLVRDDQLSAALHRAGWAYQHTAVTRPKLRGVLIASRERLEAPPPDPVFASGDLADDLAPCVAHVRLPDQELSLIGVYMPYADGRPKETLWAGLNAYARAHPTERYVILGDLNSSTQADSEGAAYTSASLSALGEVAIDAWAETANRHRLPRRDRYTWYSQTKYGRFGIRLDYAFLGPILREHLLHAHHDHTVRMPALSDHSALFVNLAL